MKLEVTQLVCHKDGCEQPATHLLLLMNIERYIPACPNHPVRASNKVEAVIGAATVLYYEEETSGSRRE